MYVCARIVSNVKMNVFFLPRNGIFKVNGQSVFETVIRTRQLLNSI